MTEPTGTAVLRLAPGVTLTRLPYGGAVVVDPTTLAIAECGEHDAARLDLLLSQGSTADPAFAAEMIDAGWLVSGRPEGKDG